MGDDIRIITEASEHYPPLLREIPQPPATLYVRGAIALLQHPHLLAVVGSRKATAYGKQCVMQLLPPVVKAGIPLVSGLAFGIDAQAHRVCVDAQQPTIAVLGGGIDDFSIYPRSHMALAQHILKHGGALVSEYPPGTDSFKSHFPERNRIIAGLCKATLLIQAATKSGSLITAKQALESNRDVCAVPGGITDPLSAGTNQLIKAGAIPITSSTDILQLYGLEPELAPAPDDSQLPETHQALLRQLNGKPQHIDILTAQVKLPAATISALLAELELSDFVQHVGGQKYVRK